jgi:predicted helicase
MHLLFIKINYTVFFLFCQGKNKSTRSWRFKEISAKLPKNIGWPRLIPGAPSDRKGSGRKINEKETAAGAFASFSHIDILDYIYAVLHSPTYREKYKEFLKIDFPRVPYPKDIDTFWKLVALGGQLRQIHLLESPIVEKYITTYPQEGSNVVGKIKYEDNKVWINDQQYFENVPLIAWEFYIGGYQPA